MRTPLYTMGCLGEDKRGTCLAWPRPPLWRPPSRHFAHKYSSYCMWKW